MLNLELRVHCGPGWGGGGGETLDKISLPLYWAWTILDGQWAYELCISNKILTSLNCIGLFCSEVESELQKFMHQKMHLTNYTPTTGQENETMRWVGTLGNVRLMNCPVSTHGIVFAPRASFVQYLNYFPPKVTQLGFEAKFVTKRPKLGQILNL